MEHYRVRRNDINKVTVDDEEYFDNLLELVKVCHINVYVEGLVCRGVGMEGYWGQNSHTFLQRIIPCMWFFIKLMW